MTGVLNALAGAPTSSIYSVTMADISSSGVNFGYNDSATPGGSISPGTFRGVTIKVVANNTSPSPDQLGVTLEGSRSQSFFTGIEIQKTDGTLAVLYTNVAIFADLTTVSSWVWEINGIWTAATPSPRRIRIFI